MYRCYRRVKGKEAGKVRVYCAECGENALSGLQTPQIQLIVVRS